MYMSERARNASGLISLYCYDSWPVWLHLVPFFSGRARVCARRSSPRRPKYCFCFQPFSSHRCTQQSPCHSHCLSCGQRCCLHPRTRRSARLPGFPERSVWPARCRAWRGGASVACGGKNALPGEQTNIISCLEYLKFSILLLL